MPGLAELQPIPFHEIFVRLCYKFDDTLRDPEVDADVKGGPTDHITAELLDELNLYLHFADVIYEAGTESRLLDIISEQGGHFFFPSQMPDLVNTMRCFACHISAAESATFTPIMRRHVQHPPCIH